jgi:hypothetical protein
MDTFLVALLNVCFHSLVYIIYEAFSFLKEKHPKSLVCYKTTQFLKAFEVVSSYKSSENAIEMKWIPSLPYTDKKMLLISKFDFSKNVVDVGSISNCGNRDA